MDIWKNRPENLAILSTSKNKKASAMLADAFSLYSFVLHWLTPHTLEMREPA